MFRIEPQGEKVALLRMDDGKVNAIGPRFVDGFEAAWSEAEADERAIVLAGNAKAFSAGLDLKVLPGLERDDMKAFVGGFTRLFTRVLSHPRPVLAAVDGPALAGGAILALCADLRLVGPRARLGLTELPIGIPFPPPILELARATLPAHEHGPAILQGVQRAGAQCVERGWAHRHVASHRLEREAIALADEMAHYSPVAYRMTKANLRADLEDRMVAFLRDGLDSYVDVLTHEETLAGILAGFQRMTAPKAGQP